MQQDKLLRVLALAGLLAAGVAQAKVSQEQANKLGIVLTPMGAIREGNGAGTIPPYAGTMLGAPKWVNYKGTGNVFPDPYPDEEPLFFITSQNFRQYKANLTDGQIALFEKYKNFQMPIYTSHRDARYSDFVHENTKYNATHTVLVAEGNGFQDGFMGTPFPIPQNGVELIWNHQASPNYEASNGELDSVSVFSDGTRSWQSNLEERWIMLFAPTLGREAYNSQPYNAKVMVQTTAPARQKGEVILVHEYRDVSTQSRDAWQYLPGTRRVRRAPTIAYDFPNGPGGLRTVDDALLFNGATDRYTWKMEPSRELYVPYNNNRLDDQTASYDKILGDNTINPKYMRYELHRCWVVVGELRPDKRHIYGKRRLYLDEDSWAGVLADNYDGQGVLWRTNARAMVNLYDLPGMGPRVELYHDLQKGAYAANYLLNEKSGPPAIPKEPLPDSYFTTAQVRKLGKR